MYEITRFIFIKTIWDRATALVIEEPKLEPQVAKAPEVIAAATQEEAMVIPSANKKLLRAIYVQNAEILDILKNKK